MKVKELLKLLEGVNPESVVLIRDNGSILPTADFDEHKDYNVTPEGVHTSEIFILSSEEWEE